MGIMDIKESIHITNQIRKQNTYSQLLSNGDTVKQLLKKPYLLYKSRRRRTLTRREPGCMLFELYLI
jgi:hypothetical protein